MHISMLGGIFGWITDAVEWLVDALLDPILEVFKALFDFIPKLMYLLYASIACLLDVLQLFFRKLAGLDIVYITDPITGEVHRTTGDILTQFITGILGINQYGLQYSILSTVFWSFIIFGVIILFASTLVAIIKSHYNYDEKAVKGPMQYVYTAGRSVVGMAIVPICIVLGLYLSQALLTALDTFTSTSNSAVVTLYGQENVSEYLFSTYTARNFDENADGTFKGEKSYVFYDILGAGSAIWYSGEPLQKDVYDEYYKGDVLELTNIAATNATFSGTLFKAAAYNANRARISNWYSRGGYTGGPDDSDFQLFKNAKGNEELAEMIDTAFACNLHASKGHPIDLMYHNGEGWAWVSPSFFTQFTTYGTVAFSKFNVGMVWYYYDLWQFNFIIGFGGIIVCFSIFLNIILGLMSRFLMCLVLFFIAPPMYGLAPLDNGQAAKNWRENFLKQVLMVYGAVVGMNLVMLILPYINQIKFFNIGIADALASTLFIIVGLITIKAVIATLSVIIGSADANKTGEDMSKDLNGALNGAIKMTTGAAKFSTKVFGHTPMVQVPKNLGSLAGKGFGAIGDAAASGNAHAIRATALGHFLTGQTKWQQKAGRGILKGGAAASDFLFGSDLREKQLLKGAEQHKKKNEFLEKYEGKAGDSVNKKDIIHDALKEGFTKRQAENMANAITKEATAVGTSAMRLPQMKAALMGEDKEYRHAATKRLWNNEANRAEFVKKTKKELDQKEHSAFNQATGYWKDANPLKWINDNVIGAHQATSGVRDAIKKPVDQQRRAADAAEAQKLVSEKMLKKLDQISEKLDKKS